MSPTEHHEEELEYSFKSLFFPFTTHKAIGWITIVGFIVYANVLFNGFVWDDLTFIINNSDSHIFNILHLFSINSFNNGGYYRPLPAVYFSLLWNLFHTTAFLYHLVQISLHIINTCLVYYFFKKVIHKSISFFLALLFLIHPIQVESVAYIGATQSELLFMPGMIALLISMRDRLTRKSLFLLSFFLLLSILTKETGVLFILIVGLYQLLFYRKRILSFILYFLSIIAVYLLIRLGLTHQFLMKNSSTPLSNLPLVERFIQIPAIVFFYIKTFLFPLQLSINQRWLAIFFTFKQFYFPLLVDFLFFSFFAVCGIFLYKKKKLFPLYLFFFLWFVIGIGFLLQLFALDMTVAERWFYFPIIGLLGMIGIIFQQFLSREHHAQKIGIIVVCLLLVMLSVRTIVRNSNWHDELGLFIHDSHISDNYDLETSIAQDYYDAGDYKDAKEHYKILIGLDAQSVLVWPNSSGLENNFGIAYLRTGDMKTAEIHFKKSHMIDPNYFPALLNLGVIYEQQYHDIPHAKHYYLLAAEEGAQAGAENYAGDLLFYDKNASDAAKFLEKYISKYPLDQQLWIFLAVAYQRIGNQQSALSAAQYAYQLAPNQTSAYVYTQILHNTPIELK